jgi:hypothetical protein
LFQKIKYIPVVLLLCCPTGRIFSQTQARTAPTAEAALTPAAPDSIRILMLYGSKPAKGHPEEPKWFGGKPGGHVAIDMGGDSTLNFGPTKYRPFCHIFSRSKPANFKSRFHIRTVHAFWRTFNYTHPVNDHADSLKGLVIVMPITPQQKQKLDSITKAYLNNTPYDYAVFGMRCASASYAVLAQLNLLDKPYKRRIWWHLLYPRDIRFELLKQTKQNPAAATWRIYNTAGTTVRKWDRDRKVK